MKFLHTADWQIGMKADHVGRAGARVREERLRAAERVCRAAREHGVDAVLLAGDVFESNGVDRVTVQRVADLLAGAGCPVFVIPGNHDPLVPGSVWDHPAWKGARGVTVLGTPEPVPFGDAVLFPCPVTDRYSLRDPTAWIDARGRAEICIGLAHGTVEGVPAAERELPIAREAAARAGLDYLALGHWHSTATYPPEGGAVRMAYAGTPEPTRFGERDSGNVLLVEIARRGAPPQVTRLPTGTLRWLDWRRQIETTADVDGLLREVEAMADPEHVLLRIELTGRLLPEAEARFARLEDLLEARFLFGHLSRLDLRPDPADEAWIETLPPGYIREAARQLRERAAAEGKAGRIAARALVELYAVAQEAAS